MATAEEPTVFRPGGVSYLRIPAPDPERLASFYGSVYPEGELTVFTFRDPAGNELGAWQRG